jgi:cell division protease FtsH
MVARWGMSEQIGFVNIGAPEGMSPFMPGVESASEATQELVDREVHRIVETEQEHTRALLTEARDKLDALAEALLERETLDEADAYRIAGVERVADGASAASPSSAP